MPSLESIYEAVLFIEENLKQPISVKDIADAVAYSLYHFSRTFNHVVGHSPYDYLIRRRLSESVKVLLSTDARIIDIALDYQFNAPETYARAFRRMFGVLPNQFRKNGDIADLILKSAVTLPYLRHINQGAYLRPSIVNLDTLHLFGLASPAHNTDSTPQLWEQLRQVVGTIPNRLKSEEAYTVSFSPLAGDTYQFVGVAVETLDNMPLSLLGKTLAAQTYVRFIHKGAHKDLPLTYTYIYQTWQPKSGTSLAPTITLRRYKKIPQDLDDPEAECEIMIPTS